MTSSAINVFLGDSSVLVDPSKNFRQFVVLFCLVWKVVQRVDMALERVIECCWLSGSESPIAYFGDAGEGSVRGDVLIESVHGTWRLFLV